MSPEAARETDVNMAAGSLSSIEPGAGRWLVLGASGFVGGKVVAELKQRDRAVIGTSRSSAITVDVLDVASLRSLFKKNRPDILLNACGQVPSDTIDPVVFYTHSTRAVLEAVASEAPACRVVLLGSAAEYGNVEAQLGALETDALRPVSEYGRAKCGQLEQAQHFSAKGLSVITARLFNPIGPGQGGNQLVGALIARVRRGERRLAVRQSRCIRDWMDVRDAARALVILADSKTNPEVVNICSGEARTVEFIAREVGRLMNVEIHPDPAELPSGVVGRSVGNPTRIFELGWRPQYDLAKTLADQCCYGA